jgi:hypothetical protein
MADAKTIIERAYSAFNERNIDPGLRRAARLWEKKRSARIGLANGASSIRTSKRWQFPRNTEARSAQLVKSLQGDILSDSEVVHVFTVKSGLIAAMELGDEADPTAGPSAAFAHRLRACVRTAKPVLQRLKPL